MDAAFTIERYTAEARVPAQSSAIGQTVAAIEALAEGDVQIAGIVRERYRRYVPTPNQTLQPDDILLLRGETDDLERLIARAKLQFASGSEVEHGELAVVEGVVTENSPLIGHTPSQLSLKERYAIGLLAVSRRGEAIVQRLATIRFRLGDVVVLRSASPSLPEQLGELKILPLAERAIALGRNDRSWLPAIVLAVAMTLVAARVVHVQMAFVAAAVVLLLMRVMTMHEAYRTIEWHILVLLGALIPISHAVRDTGGTDLIANGLTHIVQGFSPIAGLATVLVITMIVTPFLHNAPTVLILGPVAGTLAHKLHLNPDAFLMAVALGAGCDFLTPIGHQCNTLVLGPGGYRFSDYARLGFPLSVLIVIIGVPLINLVWPLSSG
jgi:di/tricarboxylate transporter